MAKRWQDQSSMRIRRTKVYADLVGAGWNGTDDTAVLQSAIDTGAGEVVIRPQAGPWVVAVQSGKHYAIDLESNQRIRFLPGATVVAKTGSFYANNDVLFRAFGKSNVSIIGNGTTWTMNRADYLSGGDYVDGEDRHGLLVLGCTNAFFSGINIVGTGGDGIFVGGDVSGYYNTNVTILNCNTDNCYRNGLAIERVTNMLVQDCTFDTTNGTNPETGVDFEPKAADAQIVNCILRRVHTIDSARGGFLFLLSNLTSSSEDVSIVMEDCTSLRDCTNGLGTSRGGVSLITKNTTPVGGSIRIEGMTITDCELQGIALSAKPADGPSVTFANTTITNPAAAVASRPPIFFTSDTGNTAPVSGFVFDNVVINDTLSRDPIEYYNGADPDVPLEGITGSISLTYDGTTTTYDPLTTAQLQTWVPAYAEAEA